MKTGLKFSPGRKGVGKREVVRGQTDLYILLNLVGPAPYIDPSRSRIRVVRKLVFADRSFYNPCNVCYVWETFQELLQCWRWFASFVLFSQTRTATSRILEKPHLYTYETKTNSKQHETKWSK